jgi:hypothetical protein
MFRVLKRRFKKKNSEQTHEQDVVLCPRCYFVAPGYISVAEYTRMHLKFNEQFVDKCLNTLSVTQPKTWANYSVCPALYHPLC